MPDDPCQEAIDLRQARRDLVLGEKASLVRFGEDEVRFTAADIDRLDAMIAEADKQCAIAEGRTPKRNRFAMRARFRPY